MSPIRLIAVTLALVLGVPVGAAAVSGCSDGMCAAAGFAPPSIAVDRTGPGPGLPGTRPRPSAEDTSPDPAIVAEADHPWPPRGVALGERPARGRVALVPSFLIPFETGPPLA